MRVVFMGSPDFAVPALASLTRQHEVVAVYAQPARPAGRGKAERPTPVAAFAEAQGLPVRTPTRLKDAAEIEAFQALEADVAVVAAYGLILPPAVLEAPRLGCLNLHASRLPRWRGAAPIHRAVLEGDRESGLTLMQMDVGLDTGPILRFGPVVPIDPDTTTGDLHDILSAHGGEMINPALHDLEHGHLIPIAQPDDGVTYAAKIDKAEARVDWSEPADVVRQRINGLSPFPGAWCQTPDGERLKLLRAAPADDARPRGADPGTLLPGPGLVVACGEGAVHLLDVQRPGRKETPAEDFLRGSRLRPGDRLA
ncbi:methionyl-tRNA formyltransferase [Roseospirillum parvum]|uniref:Methionyl-tRNA formyltransferase n=1 Tax=Roseospirillum parvum TaxID=83401 RepID=A0A1G7TJH4_9PROT|nr:methionyl-tRNA formyltransferase [Roseospirillum parvum]SDG35164.1 methionyl-tRNA formyltransferase [Roseospirillum parvum]